MSPLLWQRELGGAPGGHPIGRECVDIPLVHVRGDAPVRQRLHRAGAQQHGRRVRGARRHVHGAVRNVVDEVGRREMAPRELRVRPAAAEEEEGMDMADCGMEAYPEFVNQ